MSFVYIVDRDGELDVYASVFDAEEAVSILGERYFVNEQPVFAESSADTGAGSTRDWLDHLRRERDE